MQFKFQNSDASKKTACVSRLQLAGKIGIAYQSMKLVKAIKNVIDLACIYVGTKGCAFGVKGAIDPSRVNGESTKDTWSPYEIQEADPAVLRSAMAEGKLLQKSTPAFAAFDRRRFLSERKESAPIAISLKQAIAKRLVKQVELVLSRGDKSEARKVKAYVLSRFDPAKGVAGKSATENGCQFIAIPEPVFGIAGGFVETRAISDKRNASTLVRIIPQKASKAVKPAKATK